MRLERDHPLLVLARNVALCPEQWEDSSAAALRLSGAVLCRLANAAIDGEPIEHAGGLAFLIGALFFEAVHSRQSHSDGSFAAGLWAIGQPLNDPWLMPVRISLCHSLLQSRPTMRVQNEFEWAILQTELGDAYARSSTADRARNQELAIESHNQALDACEQHCRPQRFLAKWSKSTDSISRHNWRELRARVQTNLANVYKERVRGVRAENLAKAIRLYVDALGFWTEAGSSTEAGRLMINLGAAYLQCATRELETIDLFLIKPARDGRAGDRFYSATDIEQATIYLGRALKTFDVAGSSGDLAEVLLNIGNLELIREQQSHRKEQGQAARHYRRARGIYALLNQCDRVAMVESNLGVALALDGSAVRRAEAIEYFSSAAVTFERLHIHREAILAYTNLGEAFAQAGHWLAACDAFEQAVKFVNVEFAGGLTEVSRIAWLRQEIRVMDGLAASHLKLAESPDNQVGVSHLNQAAYWVEHAQARNLAELMAAFDHPPRGISQQAYQSYCADANRIRDLDHRIEGTERDRAAQRKTEESSDLEKRLERDKAERTRLTEMLAGARRRFAEADPVWAPGGTALSTEELSQTARRAGAALLTLRPTRWGTSAVLILPDGQITGDLIPGFTREMLKRLLFGKAQAIPSSAWAIEYQRYCQDPNDSASLARWCAAMMGSLKQLGEQLWQPLREWLAERYAYRSDDAINPPSPLVVSLSGGLSVLPIHAAWWREDGQQRWAADDYRISYVPSIWVFKRCLERQQRSTDKPAAMLAVLNPTGHVTEASLPAADYEKEWVERRFPEAEILGHAREHRYPPATRERLLKELQRCNIGLLATHGAYDPVNPWLGSGLYTADYMPGSDDRPNIALGDLFKLDLSQLRLVILSACETSLTDFNDVLSDQLGLPSAFISAGASTAVGGLWKVNDAATALLTERFFQELICEKTSAMSRPGLALWRAQQWLRALTWDDVKSLSANSRLPAISRDMVHARTDVPVIIETTDIVGPFWHPYYWAAFSCFGAF